MTEVEPSRRARPRWITGAAIAAVVLVLAATVVILQQRASAQAAIQDAAKATSVQFASAWAADDFAGVRFAARSDADVTTDYRRLTDGLGEFAVTIVPRTTVVTDQRAVSTFAVDWTLPGGVHWTTDATVDLERRDETWEVVWSPTIVHPDLTADTRLVAQRIIPDRGSILGVDNQAIVADRPVVDVGIQPSRVEDLPGLTATLGQLLGVDPVALTTRVQAASKDAFVAVITLRREDYDAVKDKIQPLPGTVFRERTLPLAPSRTFARALLGTAGDVTAEIVDASGGRYQGGDIAGLSGLQARYDEVLRGETGVKVLVTNAPLPGAPAPTGDDVTLQLDVVFEEPAVDGRPVRTTLDPKIQFAADDALADVTTPSSLVVVRPSTGEILAVANGPNGAADNLAFTGRYPPGSSFKIVSTEALLANRLSTGETVDCPATTTVDGRTFKNAENEVLGRVPFRQVFAHSCNTAFVDLSERLSDDALTTAAARFGLGGSWSVGVPAFTGSVPKTESATDRAAATIGQGRVLVSPLAMALVGATVADGSWRPPVLVKEPADPASTTGDAAKAAPLPSAEDDTLRTLMREAVTNGTGTAVANVPAPPVAGKTGTAEFGTDDPPKSHAWFVGYQGDLAFAVFVDSGEFGGDTAAPIAATLLNQLAAG